MIRKLTLFISLVAILLLPAGVAYADEIIVDGETVSADLNLSDDLQIRHGGTLNANANIFNGDAKIAGAINGNLILLGGNLTLEETATISGECILLGGKVRENLSETSCTTIGNFDLNAPNLAVANRASNLQIGPSFQTNGSPFGIIFGSLVLGLFAFATAHIAPKQLDSIGDTIITKPVVSGTVGVLTFFGTLSAATLLGLVSTVLLVVCVGILGYPVMLAMFGLLIVGLLLGWVAVGNIVGEILADQLHLHQLNLPQTAAFGTVALSIGLGLLGLLPVIGFSSGLIWWLIGGIGLGAAALTRLGTRTYPIFVVQPEKLQQTLRTLDN